MLAAAIPSAILSVDAQGTTNQQQDSKPKITTVSTKSKQTKITIENPSTSNSTIYAIAIEAQGKVKITTVTAPKDWTKEKDENTVTFQSEIKPLTPGMKLTFIIKSSPAISSFIWTTFDENNNDLGEGTVKVKVPVTKKATTPAKQATVQTKHLKLYPGWDRLDFPLDYGKSEVVYKMDNKAKSLEVTWKIVGAEKHKSYYTWISLYYPTASDCVPTFGQFATQACENVSRQGNTRGYNYIPPSTLVADENGDGTATVKIRDIAKGKYELAFGLLVPGAAVFQTTPKFGAGTTQLTFS
jgi:hypothetical protein